MIVCSAPDSHVHRRMGVLLACELTCTHACCTYPPGVYFIDAFGQFYTVEEVLDDILKRRR